MVEPRRCQALVTTSAVAQRASRGVAKLAETRDGAIDMDVSVNARTGPLMHHQHVSCPLAGFVRVWWSRDAVKRL